MALPMRILLSGLALILLAVQKDPSQQARELVEKLKSDRIERRQEAARKLKGMRRSAVNELERAAKDSDREVQDRVGPILQEIRAEALYRDLEKKLQDSGSLTIKFTGGMTWSNGADGAVQVLRLFRHSLQCATAFVSGRTSHPAAVRPIGVAGPVSAT